ncbi:hypothetical protein ON010_g11693 [Phytophthora cinnamomi]|nr:hypothetical protein ON010_g11693 [Phytophthora cinnamomi]
MALEWQVHRVNRQETRFTAGVVGHGIGFRCRLHVDLRCGVPLQELADDFGHLVLVGQAVHAHFLIQQPRVHAVPAVAQHTARQALGEDLPRVGALELRQQEEPVVVPVHVARVHLVALEELDVLEVADALRPEHEVPAVARAGVQNALHAAAVPDSQLHAAVVRVLRQRAREVAVHQRRARLPDAGVPEQRPRGLRRQLPPQDARPHVPQDARDHSRRACRLDRTLDELIGALSSRRNPGLKRGPSLLCAISAPHAVTSAFAARHAGPRGKAAGRADGLGHNRRPGGHAGVAGREDARPDVAELSGEEGEDPADGGSKARGAAEPAQRAAQRLAREPRAPAHDERAAAVRPVLVCLYVGGVVTFRSGAAQREKSTAQREAGVAADAVGGWPRSRWAWHVRRDRGERARSYRREVLQAVTIAARSTLHLLYEDIRSAQWNLENDQAEYAGEYKRLNAVSQNALREEALIERVNAALRSENAVVEDLETIWLNYRDMAHEEHRQLAVANEDAKKGFAIYAAASQLYVVQEEVNSAKFFRREIALRRKQEKNMLTITQSSIKAKDEQLTWLERQRVHLQSEHQEVAKARAADEAAYQQYREDHKSEMNAFETQIKNAGKQVKSTERAITSRNKKVVAVNKKIAQKTKVLEEWKERIDEKKEQVAKSAATQELIDGEVLSTQEALGQELRNLEHVQRLRTAQEMEAEELCSSCTALECEAQQARKTITTLKSTIVVAQTAVKNRIDEIREKFLDTFVVSDAEILIELLNKELNQRYEDLAIDARNKHDKILRQKERQYNTKLKKLKAREAEKKAKSTVASSNKSHKGGEDGMEKPLRVSATGLEVEQNESPSRELADGADSNPPRLEIRSNEDIVGEAISEKLCTSKPKQKAKTVPKQAAKSARRTLVVGLNQAAVSPQANNNLADLTTNATGSTSTKTAKAAPLTSVLQHDSNGTSGARRSRLKRRTPAQKAGKPVAVVMHPPGRPTERSIPEVEDPVNDVHPSVGAESDPAEDGIPSQGSLNSPVGCDEDPVASRSSSTNPVKKSVVASQGAAKKPHLQKVR